MQSFLGEWQVLFSDLMTYWNWLLGFTSCWGVLPDVSVPNQSYQSHEAKVMSKHTLHCISYYSKTNGVSAPEFWDTTHEPNGKGPLCVACWFDLWPWHGNKLNLRLLAQPKTNNDRNIFEEQQQWFRLQRYRYPMSTGPFRISLKSIWRWKSKWAHKYFKG